MDQSHDPNLHNHHATDSLHNHANALHNHANPLHNHANPLHNSLHNHPNSSHNHHPRPSSHQYHYPPQPGHASSHLPPDFTSRPLSLNPLSTQLVDPNRFNAYPYHQHQQSHHSPHSAPQYDPALVSPAYGQQYSHHPQHLDTIAPRALQQASAPPSLHDHRSLQSPVDPRSLQSPVDPRGQQHLAAAIPPGAPVGSFFVIDPNHLSNATASHRLANYANIGAQPAFFNCPRTALPNYAPRQSCNDLRRAAGNDAKALAKISKQSTKQKIRTTGLKPPSTLRGSGDIKAEGDIESDDSSSSSSSSRYSDSGVETAPLPATRPDDPRGSTEYATIQAVWRPRAKPPSPDSIRKGVAEFWEIAKTIRDRWKADGNAVAEAQKNAQKNQLPLLQSRVEDQRNMLEACFRVALKHGHRSVIEM